MNESYRCLYCDITVDGPDAWIEHINTSAHRLKLLGPAMQQDPGDDYEPEYLWTAAPDRQHDND